MRHRVAGKKLGRSPAHRRALFRNLVTELLDHEVVRTTGAKAKELRRWGDRMITLGKRGTLHARRQAAAVVQRASVVQKLFGELAGRYGNRAGGYTRVVKLGVRPGDAAEMAVVELVDRPGTGESTKGGKGGGRGRAKQTAAAGAEPAKKPQRRRAAAGA
ncbi:MAG TPA: 50S ribosomal protein L17 [Candidatus Limnocylindria bacterium]|nr:50S ribosomal protein L17 [Candidatus Limnocylindria bacterium]